MSHLKKRMPPLGLRMPLPPPLATPRGALAPPWSKEREVPRVDSLKNGGVIRHFSPKLTQILP